MHWCADETAAVMTALGVIPWVWLRLKMAVRVAVTHLRQTYYRARLAWRPLRYARVERIEHRMLWSDGELTPGVVLHPSFQRWVTFQTYAWASHGFWTFPREPWVIIEERPVFERSSL